MAYIYEYIKHSFNTINDGIFLDLGSGTGKPVISMSLMHKFKKLTGVEFLQNLVKLSQQIKETYNKTINEKIEKNKKLFNFETPNIVEFVQGDFFKRSWEDASIIFANSTCFSLDMINKIAEKLIRNVKVELLLLLLQKN